MMLLKKLVGNCMFFCLLVVFMKDSSLVIYRVHGDVFRPPPRKNILAALIGSGIQIFLMSFIVIGLYLKENCK